MIWYVFYTHFDNIYLTIFFLPMVIVHNKNVCCFCQLPSDENAYIRALIYFVSVFFFLEIVVSGEMHLLIILWVRDKLRIIFHTCCWMQSWRFVWLWALRGSGGWFVSAVWAIRLIVSTTPTLYRGFFCPSTGHV